MKEIVILSVIAVLATVGHAAVRCKTQDECGETECCKDVFFNYALCKQRGSEGEPCMAEENYGKNINGEDLYHIMCPCLDGLKCQPESMYIDDNGKTIYVNPRCVKE
uniref:U88-Liphistoxin-Lsp1a_1 n=1 Tax=Liphistius sp. SGP-2016 TaxID=1905180 RepID=A0A4Q8K7M6_9ARAC